MLCREWHTIEVVRYSLGREAAENTRAGAKRPKHSYHNFVPKAQKRAADVGHPIAAGSWQQFIPRSSGKLANVSGSDMRIDAIPVAMNTRAEIQNPPRGGARSATEAGFWAAAL